ncbi:MAG TPA: glycosyltransferase family 39 protein [bacterium]|nr:glycosyltransferase family 39 protein [bacterium]
MNTDLTETKPVPARPVEVTRSIGWLIGLVFLGTILLRLISLDADPPCTVGPHFISDEGWWVHNARNKVLFGTWIMDEFNQSLLVSPPFCLGTYAVYSIAGVSYATSRILPVLSGLMCILLLTGIVQRYTDRRTAVTALLLFGFNFGFTHLNRTAYVDSTALMFLLFAWWLMENLSDRVWGVFLAGMSIALAVASKSYVLSVGPPLLIVLMLRIPQIRRRTPVKAIILNLLLFTGGIFSVYMLWRKYIYLPNINEYRIMYHLWQDGNFPSSIGQFLRNLPSFFVKQIGVRAIPARFFMLNGGLVLLALIRIVQLMTIPGRNLREKWQRVPQLEREALIFIAVLCAEIAPLTAKPFRRYIFLYLPLVILAASCIRSVDIRSGFKRLNARILYGATAVITGGFLLLVPPFLERLLPRSIPLIPAWGIAAAATLAASIPLAYVICRFYLLKHHRLHVSILLSVVLLIDGGLHLHSMLTRSYSLRDTSRHLGREYFGSDAVILGGIAHSLSLETQARPIAIWGRQEAPRVLNQDPVRRFHPDYLIILTSLDGIRWIPEERYGRYVRTENFLETLEMLPCGNGFRVTADLYRAPVSEPVSPDSEKLLVTLPAIP